MCDGCSLKETPACRERFYGIRVEHGKVTTCIDWRKQGVTQFSFGEFQESLDLRQGTPHDIKLSYQKMKALTEK